MDLESIIGKRWMTWAAVLVLVVSGGFLVRYLIAHEIIGPLLRTVLGLVLAAGVTVGGERLLRRGMRALGMGLTALGLGLSYASLWGGYALPDTPAVPQLGAFLGMAITTAVGVGLALLREAPPIAILAALGGYLTPVLVSSGHGDREGLFLYLALLDIGVLAVALQRRWMGLELTSLVGTTVLVAGFLAARDAVRSELATAAWLAGFGVLQQGLPLLWHARRREAVRSESLAQVAAAAALTVAGLWLATGTAHPWPTAMLVLVLAALQGGIAWQAATWFAGDARCRLVCALLGIAGVLAGTAIALEGEVLTVVWSAFALVLWTAASGGEPWLRRLGAAAAVLAILRCAGMHLPVGHHPDLPLFNGTLPWALLAPAVLAVGAWLARRPAAPEPWERAWAAWGFWVALLWTALDLSLDLHAFVGARPEAWYGAAWIAPTLIAAPWLAAALTGLAWRRDPTATTRTAIAPAPVAAWIATLVAVACLIQAFLVIPDRGMPVLNLRILASAIALGTAVLLGRRLGGSADDAAGWATGIAWFLLRTALSIDIWQHLHGPLAASSWAADGPRAVLTAVPWILGAWISALRSDQRSTVRHALSAVGMAVAAILLLGACAATPVLGWLMLNPASVAVLLLAGAVATACARHAGPGLAIAGLVATTVWAGVGLDLVLSAYLGGPSRESWLASQPEAAALALPWLLLAAAASGCHRWWTPMAGWVWAGGLAIQAVVLLALCGYLESANGAFPLLNLRCATAAIAIGLGCLWAARLPSQEPLRRTLWWLSGIGAFLVATAEAYDRTADLSGSRQAAFGAVSMAWALSAIALVSLGFWLRMKALRIIALVLFLATLAKLALLDLAMLRELARILSFAGVGVAMLAVSWLYHWLERRLGR